MTEVALLNPQQELDACRALLALVKVQKDDQAATILSRILPHDDYLSAMGAYLALERAVNTMEAEYGRIVNR